MTRWFGIYLLITICLNIISVPVFASEITFTNPTFWDLPGTVVQDPSRPSHSSYVLRASSQYAEQFCWEFWYYLGSYIEIPNPGGTRRISFYDPINAYWTWHNTGGYNQFSEIICSTSPLIGEGRVTGTWTYTKNIYWDKNFPWFWSGSVANIKIKARVNPSLNMEISAEEIDLGVLIAGVASTGSLFIEVGTNAKSGVSITARSQSGGLTHTTDAGIQINDLTTDGVVESYTWASTPNLTDDSANGSFVVTGLTALEVNDNSTEHIVYDTNKAEATNLVDDVEFIVSATAQAETPAGDYEDHVTFTVTGSF